VIDERKGEHERHTATPHIGVARPASDRRPLLVTAGILADGHLRPGDAEHRPLPVGEGDPHAPPPTGRSRPGRFAPMLT